MKSYLKLIVLLFFASLVKTTYGQVEYIVKSSYAYNYDGKRRFQDVSLRYPIHDIYNSTNWRDATLYKPLSNSNNSQTYMKVVKNSYVGLYLDYRDFQSLSDRNPKMLYYKITSPTSYTGQSYYDKIWACHGWSCKTHKGNISFNVVAHDIPQITSVSYSSYTSGFCNGSSFCINNDNDKLCFNLSATNHGNASLYIYAYNKSNAVIGYVDIGEYNSTKHVTLSSLGIPRNYNGEVRFRVRSSLGGQYAHGSYTSYYIFSKMLPAPTSKIMTRTACLDEVRIAMPRRIAANYSNYRFIWINGPRDIPLTSYYSRGNYIYLRNNSASPFPTSSGSLTIQIAHSTSDNCARNFSVSYGSKPSYLSIAESPSTRPIPVVKATFDGTSHHVSKYGASDGEIILQITGGSGSRISRFEYYNSDWETIPSSQLTYLNSTKRKFTGLVANRTNHIRVFDTDGCVKSGYTTLPALRQPAYVTLNQPTASTVTCHINNSGTGSKSDGVIQATFIGGIGNYTAILYNNSGTPLETKTVTASDKSGSNYFAQFSPRGVGRYRVRVTDTYGVYKDQYIDVTSNPEVILSATPTDLTCFENSSGSVQLSVANKRTTYATFELTGEASKYTSVNTTGFSRLTAGTYTAMVTNTDGCQDIVNNVLAGEPNNIIINATGSKIARYGDNTGTIDLDISEGTGDFDFFVYNHSGNVKVDSGNTTQNTTITGLDDGHYWVEVTDDNGCPQTHSNIRVRQPDAPLELSFSQQQQNVDCHGNATAEVYPTATGGWGHYQYGINNVVNGTNNTIGGLTATGAVADTVFVIDSAGVIEKLPITTTEPTQLITSIDNTYNLKCFEDNLGAAKLNISGGTPGYRVKTDNTEWLIGDSLSNLSIMNSEPVHVLDANGCPAQVDVTITQPDKITIAVDTVIDAFCKQNNGGVSAIITGGTESYSYNWIYLDSLKSVPVNSNNISSIYSGQYELLLTDANNCSDSLTVSVSDINGPEVLAYNIDSISCLGGSDGKLTIQQVNGGMPEYTYYLDGIVGNATFEGLKNQTYHFRILDKKGCKFDKYYTIPEPDEISITSTVVNPVCHDSFDGLIVTQISGGNGGYTYNWSNNSIDKDLKNLNSGNYALIVTDKKACAKSDSFEVIPPLAPSAPLAQNVGVLCTGNSLELDGGNFANYQWYKDAVLVSEERYLTVEQTGQYTLKISNEYGCNEIDTFDLKVSDTPLDAKLLLQDSALVDEVVRAIDVTWPVPDSIQWYFDYPVNLEDNNNYSQKFSLNNTAIVNITLRAWYGGCFSDSSKSVTIYYEEGGTPQKSDVNEPLILGYKAYPNPNDGNFYVGVELSRQTDISLHLFNVGLGSAIDINRQYGLESYNVPFNLTGLNPGVYIIILVAEHEQQRLKIVIE